MKILLVEDDYRIAQALAEALTDQHYAVDIAADGQEGWNFAEAFTYDLILLDVMLPKLDGNSLCQRLRRQGLKTPVLMLTARDTSNDKVMGLDAGADDYIVKPFDFKELLVRIRALLKRINQNISVGNILKVGDLVINLDSKEVARGGNGISLTAKEFQLLEYLVRNRNKVVSRADIALNVWDIDFDTKTNVIDVYVNFLRKKLDHDHEKKIIHTQVGVGYILKEPS